MASDPVLSVTGTVTFRERVAVPPGAVATVKLVDTEGEVLAAAATEVNGLPAEFVLHADSGLIADPDTLLIWAVLRSDSGVWGTTELVPVGTGTTPVLLTKIDD
jgi:putative lipoprotein